MTRNAPSIMLSIFRPQEPVTVTTIDDFFAQNEFCPEELDDIFQAFARRHAYLGGGGAAEAFAVKRYEAGDTKRTMEEVLDPPDPAPEDDEPRCVNSRGHSFVIQDTEEIRGEGRSYCQWCGADGDA